VINAFYLGATSITRRGTEVMWGNLKNRECGEMQTRRMPRGLVAMILPLLPRPTVAVALPGTGTYSTGLFPATSVDKIVRDLALKSMTAYEVLSA
jgi:hypothetical protein